MTQQERLIFTQFDILFGSLENFVRNPQYAFTLSDPDPYDNKIKCSFIITLAQLVIDRNQTLLSIGFKIYEVNIRYQHKQKYLNKTNFYKVELYCVKVRER